ncbi:MAG: hypothetical protein V7647_2452 [Acidobacteriota bacterium]|jgi:hypothetical protein
MGRVLSSPVQRRRLNRRPGYRSWLLRGLGTGGEDDKKKGDYHGYAY